MNRSDGDKTFPKKINNRGLLQSFNAAVRSGNLDNIKSTHKILEAGGVNLSKNYVLAANSLMESIYIGHIPSIKYLLDSVIRLDSQKQLVKYKFLADSISNYIDRDSDKACEIVKILLNAGADINEKNHQGYTPLMLAANAGAIDLAGILLDAGADLDILDNRKVVKAEVLAFNNGSLSIYKMINQARKKRENVIKQQKNNDSSEIKVMRMQLQRNFRSYIRNRKMHNKP